MRCWRNPCLRLLYELQGEDHRRDNESSAAADTAEGLASSVRRRREKDPRAAKQVQPYRQRLRCPPIRDAQYPAQDFDWGRPTWDFFAATIPCANRDCAA